MSLKLGRKQVCLFVGALLFFQSKTATGLKLSILFFFHLVQNGSTSTQYNSIFFSLFLPKRQNFIGLIFFLFSLKHNKLRDNKNEYPFYLFFLSNSKRYKNNTN